jgi:hypothetical protein
MIDQEALLTRMTKVRKAHEETGPWHATGGHMRN